MTTDEVDDGRPAPAGSVPERLLGRIDGTWGSLVGAWPAYVRVLHPASAETDTGWELRRWCQLPGWDRIADPGQVGWESLTGVRLHEGTTSAGWDHEPTVGPAGDVFPSLVHALVGPEVGMLWVGQWRGYGLPDPPGSRVVSLWRGAREYAVVPVDARDVVQRTSPTGGGPTLVPDIVWDADRHCVALADIDLPCTIVGCVEPVARRLLSAPALEAYVASGSDPVVL